MEWWSLRIFFKGCSVHTLSEPRRRIEEFFLSRWSWSDKCSFFLSLDFFSTVFFGFRTHVVATTVCTTGGVQTLTCRTHIFLLHSLSTHIRTSSCVSHTRMAQGSSVCKKSVCVCVLDLSISSHDSPVFLAVPARSLRDQSRLRSHCWLRHPHDLAVLSRPESAGDAPLRTCIAMFGYLTRSDANTGYEPKEFDMITAVDNHDAHQRSDPPLLRLPENHER